MVVYGVLFEDEKWVTKREMSDKKKGGFFINIKLQQVSYNSS